MSDYTSWDSLIDRSFNGRHLPPVDMPNLPPVDEVVDGLFGYREKGFIESEKSTVLFSHFAQWFTDGFLRTDRNNRLKNTSNHDIDLSPLYGLNRAEADILRHKTGGRLKSQMINGEEYPPYYYENGQPKAEFANLPIFDFPSISLEQRNTLFAMGGDRANVHIGYSMMNALFLREHNRICAELANAYGWKDDERLFQTARNVLIVVLMKLVVEEYINHITPYHFKFRVEPARMQHEPWYWTNWMTAEFNLLYRWHTLTPPSVSYDGKQLPTYTTTLRNDLITDRGLGVMFAEATQQPAGVIGLHNTVDFLRSRADKPSIEQGRLSRLASYNDYRDLFSFPRVTAFDQITEDEETQEELRGLYGEVDNIELVVGLFAEDTRRNSALPALIGRMVGVDAFSQALTSPLLSKHVFNANTFTKLGMDIISETESLSQILHRNIPDDGRTFPVSMTRLDWKRR